MAKNPGLIYDRMPSAQTLFRIRIIDAQTYDLVRQGISRMKPLLWLRDGRNVKRIEQAQTPEEVLDMVPLASGLGELAWHAQMRKLGPEALPLIAVALKQAVEIRDENVRDKCMAHLIAELRWRGQAGAQVLMEGFEALDDFGRSLACVVLGLLGARPARGLIWSYYQEVKQNLEESDFIGALWGLVDLRDERASEALAGLLATGQDFFELYGFLSRAGDASAVVPLLSLASTLPKEDQVGSMMSLVGIAHRIGREALVSEIEKAAAGEESRKEYEALADIVLSKPASLGEEYFATFYRGIRPDDVAGVLDHLAS